LKYTLLFLLFASAALSAQPATFNTRTGMLELPSLVVDDQASYTDVTLNLTDAKTGQFQLVDFKRGDGSENKVQQLTLTFGETIQFNENTTLTFTKLLTEDRCPSDVVCITAGKVTVLIELVQSLADGNTRITGFSLTLQGLSLSEHVHKGTYFRLAQADPYPISTVETSEDAYVIVVEYSSVPFQQ